jgi:hypothetical protein
VFVLTLPQLNDLLGASGMPVQFRSVASDQRFDAWLMFLKAMLLRPWFGFGWGQLGFAQFLMAQENISMGGSMLQSHNLLLDLLLWNGFPLGLVLIFVMLWTCITLARRIATFGQLWMSFFVMVLGVHSMLEYPLHYAFFLLPTGLIVGALIQSVGVAPIAHSPRWVAICLILVTTTILVISTRDYFRVETSYYGLRFELKKIPTNHSKEPPDVLSMNQWRRYLEFARQPLTSNLTEQLREMSNLVQSVPSAYVLYKYAAQLAVNDRITESQNWLKMMCSISPVQHCEIIKAEWFKQAQDNPKFGAVKWPP